MSTIQTFNNASYTIPTQGDPAPWGPNLDRYLVALGTYAFSPAGGSYPLTANLNLGSSFGLVVPYYTTATASPATAGVLRLAKTDSIAWHNNLGSGNNLLAVDGSDNLTYNGTVINNNLASLNNGQIWIGNVSNVPVGRAFTGDVTVSNTGVTTIPAGTITNAYINNSAAIAYSKLSLTGSILNADIFSGAAIAYSKLNLTGSIVNADVNASASIAYSKLALTGSIVNADLTSGVYSAITGVGTQSQALDMNSHKVTNLTNGSSAQDATAFGQVLGFRVLQLISAQTTTALSTSSATYVATHLAASITPTSASSKIIVVSANNVQTASTNQITLIHQRSAGSTNLTSEIGTLAGATVRAGITLVDVDSPATTSAITYTVMVKSDGGTVIHNNVLTSTMILLEIG